MALDAISTPTIVEKIPKEGRTWWAINGMEADASTAIEVKAAPAAGFSHYITAIAITCDDDDCDPAVHDDAAAVLFGPIFAKVAGPLSIVKEFSKPIKVASGKAIDVKAAAAGTFSIWIEGATARG